MRSLQLRYPGLGLAACLVALACVCRSSLAAHTPEPPTDQPSPTKAAIRRNHADATAARGWRQNNLARPQANAASVHCEYKELMTNLHDRVGILATLDEDQRNRLAAIDEKLGQLLQTNSARMESIKVQQLDFQKRLDSFEHIQRLSRNTLDELKGETGGLVGSRLVREHKQKQINQGKLLDLTRNTRAAHEAMPTDATGYPAGIFNMQPESTGRSKEPLPEPELDVPQRLEAVATLLASTALNVADLQQNIGQVLQKTNNIQRRLNHKGPRPDAAHNGYPLAAAGQAATSCVQNYGASNGIVKLQLTPESDSFYVACTSDDWTIIMQRFSGNINFERGWLDYKAGFGNLAAEFFIGLDKLHALTASAVHELRIVLEDFEGNTTVAGYSLFAIGGEKDNYPLSLLGSLQPEASSAGDSLSYQAGARFSTFDHDNDNCVDCNCALKHKGGWWYTNCAASNLHGKYHTNGHGTAGESGIFWDTFRGVNYSLKRVQMSIRPVGQDEARR